MDIDGIVKKALSRRSFLAAASGTAAATMLAGCSDDGTVVLPTASTTYTDADILNFALNLEYLEAEFNLRAATGSGLSAADAGTGAGAVNGGTKITGLTTVQQNVINEVAFTEQQHVRVLRAALGPAAVSRPIIDLTGGFTGAATAANSLSAASTASPAIPATFSPFANYDSWLVGTFVFEDVGVTAYNGAAPLISSAGIAAGYLTAAAGILAVEAYHAGSARSQLIGNTIAQGTTAYPFALYANRIALLRAALTANGGATSASTGKETLLAGFSTAGGASTTTTITATGSTVVPADSTALAYSRTTDQVLHIVYGTFSPTAGATAPAAGVNKGGFFPNGLNGTIKTTLS